MEPLDVYYGRYTLEIENKPEVKSNVEKLELYSDHHPFTLLLRVKEFSTSKELAQFVKRTEKLVRLSPEYKLWINYIVDVLGRDVCSFTKESMTETKVEIHHYPISLYTVCLGIINTRLDKKESFCSFDIALEVIECHFKNIVGYIPLLRDLHQKAHNGYLRIPIDMVHGNYKRFMEKYSLDEYDENRIKEREKIKGTGEYPWGKDNYPGVVSGGVQ